MTGGAFDTADHPAYHQKHYDACRDKKDSFVDESQVRNWPGDHPRELNDEDEALVELLLPVATVLSHQKEPSWLSIVENVPGV